MMKPINLNAPSGFTFLELMIVLAIIGILAAIALPEYERMQTLARRAEGISVLQQIRLSEAQYFLDHQRYSNMESELAIYGLMPSPNTLKYYDTRALGPVGHSHTGLKTGYFALLQGNIDQDVTAADTLLLKSGTFPGIWGSVADGISIIIDDTVL